MEDVTIVEKILCSLTPKFDYVVCSIEELKDIDAFSLDELQSSLLVYEQKMNQSTTIEEKALKASTSTHFSNSRGRGRGRGRGDEGKRDGSKHFKANDDQFQGKGRGRDQHFEKSKVECFRCHKFGHYDLNVMPSCQMTKKSEKIDFAVEKNESETLLMAYHVNEELQSNVWHVDIGCSNHMCGRSFMALAFRYGHLNFVGLKTLQQKDKVTSLPQITIPSQVCEECVVSKQHRSQFPQGKSWRAKSVLELIHSDICGPINPSSNGAAYTPQQNGVSERKNRTILNGEKLAGKRKNSKMFLA
ncbi:hypothetical protein CK203_064660 [Vitis vinifera]|uniref:GAG-pre-integrase domain-containing protein n=1 Tax=Vitis vinifera TaxID=29760 RepID=A0A438G9J1_VITVI|nr:hypothetical protein CK203_064660 [Vitis vinifera]